MGAHSSKDSLVSDASTVIERPIERRRSNQTDIDGSNENMLIENKENDSSGEYNDAFDDKQNASTEQLTDDTVFDEMDDSTELTMVEADMQLPLEADGEKRKVSFSNRLEIRGQLQKEAEEEELATVIEEYKKPDHVKKPKKHKKKKSKKMHRSKKTPENNREKERHVHMTVYFYADPPVTMDGTEKTFDLDDNRESPKQDCTHSSDDADISMTDEGSKTTVSLDDDLIATIATLDDIMSTPLDDSTEI